MTLPGSTPARNECRSCRKPVVWTVTAATGKSMPINPHPCDEGNVRLERREGDVPVAHVLNRADAERVALEGSTPLYLSHFATCPAARGHRL